MTRVFPQLTVFPFQLSLFLFPVVSRRERSFIKWLVHNHGRVQVHDRVVPQEAVRRLEVLAQDPLLAVQATDQGAQGTQVHQTRQGPQARLQKQAG